jgi:hypothetical protein
MTRYPPPPYAVSLYHGPNGYERPYVVRSMATGQGIAGHIDSLACARAVADALNGAAARGLLGIE